MNYKYKILNRGGWFYPMWKIVKGSSEWFHFYAGNNLVECETREEAQRVIQEQKNRVKKQA